MLLSATLLPLALLSAAPHYEKPVDGRCSNSDERAVGVMIGGLPNYVCAANCTEDSDCPTDVPDKCSAKPQCGLIHLRDGSKLCGLLCMASSSGSTCGDSGSVCQSFFPSAPISPGLCTYPVDSPAGAHNVEAAQPSPKYASAVERFSFGFTPDPVLHARLDKLPVSNAAVPTAIDWRTRGAVTPVKDQGQCGSCWSFSTTGVIEGAAAIANGRLVSLSEQELMDCTTGSTGCEGGRPIFAASWVVNNGGIASEKDYHPYDLEQWRCDRNESAVKDASISGVLAVHETEEALLAAVAQQPVSIGIMGEPLQTYKSGVVSTSCDLSAVNQCARRSGLSLPLGYTPKLHRGPTEPGPATRRACT